MCLCYLEYFSYDEWTAQKSCVDFQRRGQREEYIYLVPASSQLAVAPPLSFTPRLHFERVGQHQRIRSDVRALEVAQVEKAGPGRCEDGTLALEVGQVPV